MAVMGFRNYFAPEFLLICNDAIVDQNFSLSLITLIDRAYAVVLPLTLPRFVVVAQFIRNLQILESQLLTARPELKVILMSPSGKFIEIDSIIIQPSNRFVEREHVIFDLSGKIELNEFGLYVLKVIGKADDSPFEELMSKSINVEMTLGPEGLYLAEFVAISRGHEIDSSGTGFVLLMPDGKIQGGDGGYAYSGSYMVENMVINAVLEVTRIDSTARAVIGDVDKFALKLSGELNDNQLVFEGTPVGLPEEKLRIILKRQAHAPSFG